MCFIHWNHEFLNLYKTAQYDPTDHVSSLAWHFRQRVTISIRQAMHLVFDFMSMSRFITLFSIFTYWLSLRRYHKCSEVPFYKIMTHLVIQCSFRMWYVAFMANVGEILKYVSSKWRWYYENMYFVKYRKMSTKKQLSQAFYQQEMFSMPTVTFMFLVGPEAKDQKMSNCCFSGYILVVAFFSLSRYGLICCVSSPNSMPMFYFIVAKKNIYILQLLVLYQCKYGV